MKNLVYLSVAFLCFTVGTSAQTTVSSLEGIWKIEAIETSEMYFELNTGKMIFNPGAEQEPIDPTEMEAVAEMMKEELGPIYSNFLKFDKNNFSISYAGKTGEGTFTIKEKEGQQYIEVTYSTGTVKEIPFTIKDNLLYIEDKGSGGKLIYKLA